MRLPSSTVVPEHPWDGRATRPPLANVAAKSTSGIYVPSRGSPTHLGLWQLRPNYPLGALTKECAATRCTKPARHHPPAVGPFELALSAPRHVDALSLRSRVSSRSGQCAFPSALTRQFRAHKTSRRFRVHVRSRLPARRQR